MTSEATTLNFDALLEEAFNSEATFFEKIMPALQPPLVESRLESLIRVFETGGVVARQLVARLFAEKLKEAGAAFLAARLDPGRPRIFAEAAIILGGLKYEAALEKLVAGISVKTPDLVLPAVKAISLLPASRRVDEALLTFYLNFSDEVKLSASIRYLLTRQESLVHQLLEKYRGLDADRRMWVLKFLAETGNAEALKLFSEELEAEPLERGLYCIKGLGRIASDQSVTFLARHLGNPEWFVRKRLVEALGATGMAGAISPLLDMLDDDSVQVRAAAVESLSKVGNLQPELLVRKLEKAAAHVKINLIRVMGQLQNESFVKPLVEILKDRETLFFSIDAIGDLGFPQAEFALRRLLKDDVWFNRLNALEALAKLKIDAIVQLAQEASQDENDMVRNAAARILAAQKKR
jgi:HEAT repeat protein